MSPSITEVCHIDRYLAVRVECTFVMCAVKSGRLVNVHPSDNQNFKQGLNEFLETVPLSDGRMDDSRLGENMANVHEYGI